MGLEGDTQEEKAQPLGSLSMADPTSIRLDDQLKADAQLEADALGVTLADFIRQSIAMRVGFILALRLVLEGEDAREMLDGEALLAALRRAVRDLQPLGHEEQDEVAE